jgi:phospho-N-acetylmuramoyl-pentapeptide-transferase
MLYHLSLHYTHIHHLANLLHYLTVRSAIAAFISLLISIIFGKYIINILKNYQTSGQPIRDDGPETHKDKAGTPTMGGVMIILSSLISCSICCNWNSPFVLLSLFVFVVFGLLGYIDDYLKVAKKNHKGVSAKTKMLAQIIVSGIIYFVVAQIIPEKYTYIYFPYFKNIYLDLGVLFFPFVVLVVSGSSNAVNLTDGLDGLAIVPFGLTAFCFGIIAYFVGNKGYANYLHILHIPGACELAVVCSSLIGSSIGFLWFNAKPAEIFMGDTGSLALGGFLGVISILTKQEFMLCIAGGIFVIEALSVIIQIAYFKITKGKRVFKMAPIHHHYEKAGLPETKVVIRFWILSLMFTIVALISFKIR